MSTRVVSPHSATIRPPRSTRPFGPPRGRTGPSVSFHGGHSWRSLVTIRARSRDHGVSHSPAWRAAAARASGSSPTSAGVTVVHGAGCGGGEKVIDDLLPGVGIVNQRV